ncbi:MAG: hypothetical protein Q8Q79_10085 [Sphingopyxis sp.]|nr:hypothetical protein [Sphingopyxis bauzanensis]MDP3783255.1 hypothetical protein [Sphingopyxis sp.]
MPDVAPLQLARASLDVLNNRPRHWNNRSLDVPHPIFAALRGT